MPKKDQNQDLAISAAIEGYGLSIKAKSRAVSALDRLLGGLFDALVIRLDRANGRYSAQTDNLIAMIQEDGEAARRALKESDAAGRLTLDNFYREAQIKQENKARIAIEAGQLLLESDISADDDMSAEDIDPDWMNTFTDYAEKASTQDRQSMWARVLAGKIKRPEVFSISTLRVIAEIDKEKAELFTRTVKFRIGDKLQKPNELSGTHLGDMISLENSDLLSQVNGFIHINVKSVGNEDQVCFTIQPYMLRFINTKHVQLNCMVITEVGMDICNILPKQKPDEVLREWARYSQHNHIILSEIVGNIGQRLLFLDVETLRSPENP